MLESPEQSKTDLRGRFSFCIVLHILGQEFCFKYSEDLGMSRHNLLKVLGTSERWLLESSPYDESCLGVSAATVKESI